MNAPVRVDPRIERTRAALIAAGRTLFSERAMDAVTVDDIVRAAGVGKGSFYNHFADREALVHAVSGQIRAGIEAAVAQANQHESDPARRIARAVCVYLRFAIDAPDSARMLVRLHGGMTSPDAPLNRGLVEDIADGLTRERIAVPTLESGVLYVLGATQITLARLCREPSNSLAVSFGQQMCSLLLRGFGLSAQEAEIIAAQASDDVIRRGAP